MKFAHIADCHVGGWSEVKLKELGMQAFSSAIQTCIEKKVDFVIIAGDLFNTAIPSIDLIKQVTLDLNNLKEKNISCYIIPGSHDYSPSGKTMLDVLENAGLVKNVVKFVEENDKINLEFTIDPKTNIKITGLFGKAGGLEKSYYEGLNREILENDKSKKIFMFHTTLTEFKPEHLAMISSEPVAILPKGFDYYAGGHPHYIFNEVKSPYGRIAYPGALFPNNFGELEKFKFGGFWINEFLEDESIRSEYIEIKLKEVVNYTINLDNKDSHQVLDYILTKIDKNEIIGKIVLLRLQGALASGRLSDIDFVKLNEELGRAFIVLRNSSKLTVKELEVFSNEEHDAHKIEENLIKEVKSFDQDLVEGLMNVLNDEKIEGEKNFDFENRILKNAFQVLKLENDNK